MTDHGETQTDVAHSVQKVTQVAMVMLQKVGLTERGQKYKGWVPQLLVFFCTDPLGDCLKAAHAASKRTQQVRSMLILNSFLARNVSPSPHKLHEHWTQHPYHIPAPQGTWYHNFKLKSWDLNYSDQSVVTNMYLV